MSLNQRNVKKMSLPKIRMLSRGRPPATIRITHVKSIKPPDPELVKKQEEDKLRAELQREIVLRSRGCAHQGYECTQPIVCGREYCARHILQDATAPYKRCTHTSSSGGERCELPAPAHGNDNRRDQGLCYEHARAALKARQRSTAPPPPVTTTETLLNQLQHYVRPERTRTTSCASSVSVVSEPNEEISVVPKALDPFKQMDASAVNACYSSGIMECASAGESDADSVVIGGDDDEHDEYEEAPWELHPLRLAGVYTAEEAVRCALESLVSLRAGYIKQLGRLTWLLRSARAKFVKNLKTERENCCSINSQARSGNLTALERKQLRKLKAFASYRRKHGPHAVLARKLYYKRLRSENGPGPARGGRCVAPDGSARCGAAALPATKYCNKHVLLDKQQVLFSACGDRRGLTACTLPQPSLPLPSPRCPFHTDPPHYTSFTLKKDGTDSDVDSSSNTNDDSRTDTAEPAEMHSDNMELVYQ